MKKPQCQKPTSYNCGQACINLSKSCQQSPSDTFGRERLQKLKQVAAIYAKSKGVKNNKSKESVDKLISNITTKRNAEAKSLSEDRKEINETRRRTRLKAEAVAKREQLLKMYEELGGNPKANNQTAKILDAGNPSKEIEKRKVYYRQKVGKVAKTNIKEAEKIAESALNAFKTIDKESQDFLEKSRQLVQVKLPTKINSSVKSKEPDAHQKGVEAFSRMVSIPNLKDPIEVVDTPPERKGRSCYKANKNQLQMGNSDPAVVVHEMSHWLEEKVPGIREEVQAFYEKRTQGEKPVKMSEATGNKSYRDNEVTKVDKWLNPYMGKEYKNASEILSMGMEMMYRNPAYLAKNDPEMFDFIYSVVRRG